MSAAWIENLDSFYVSDQLYPKNWAAELLNRAQMKNLRMQHVSYE